MGIVLLQVPMRVEVLQVGLTASSPIAQEGKLPRTWPPACEMASRANESNGLWTMAVCEFPLFRVYIWGSLLLGNFLVK